MPVRKAFVPFAPSQEKRQQPIMPNVPALFVWTAIDCYKISKRGMNELIYIYTHTHTHTYIYINLCCCDIEHPYIHFPIRIHTRDNTVRL